MYQSNVSFYASNMYYALFVCIDFLKNPNNPITIPFIFHFMCLLLFFFNYENSKGSANVIDPIALQMKQLGSTY